MTPFILLKVKGFETATTTSQTTTIMFYWIGQLFFRTDAIITYLFFMRNQFHLLRFFSSSLIPALNHSRVSKRMSRKQYT